MVLLSDIRDIFNRTAADRMASEDLITALLDLDDRIWAEYRGPRDDQQSRELSQGEMARLLRPFHIRPRSIWPLRRRKGSSSRKGYYPSQFTQAWQRYCPEDGTPAQGSNVAYIGNR